MIASIFGTGPHLQWWQECDRTILVFAFGLALVRASGHRTFSKWSALDTVVSIVAGSSLSRAITGNAPLFGTIAATALLVILHGVLARACAGSRRISSLFEGAPVPLGRDGSVDDGARRHHSVSHSDLEEAMRGVDVGEVAQARLITLEPSGKITVLKK